MTRYLIEEINRCRLYSNEFVKYITDQKISKKIDAIFETSLAHMEIGNSMLNTFVACTVLWKALYTSEYSIGILSKQSDFIMEKINDILERLPSFLKMQYTVSGQNYISFRNGSSIRLAYKPINLRGSCINLLGIVNPQDISNPELNELKESLFPVVSSRGDGKIFYVRGKRTQGN